MNQVIEQATRLPEEIVYVCGNYRIEVLKSGKVLVYAKEHNLIKCLWEISAEEGRDGQLYCGIAPKVDLAGRQVSGSNAYAGTCSYMTLRILENGVVQISVATTSKSSLDVYYATPKREVHNGVIFTATVNLEAIY
jgi:hypothetical protein